MLKRITLLLLIVVLLTGCSKPVPEKDMPGKPVVSPNPEKEVKEVYLYFVDKQFNQIFPEKRKVVVEHKLERTLIEELIKGPESPELSPTLPKDISIISVDTIEGLVYVNLSRDFYYKFREKGLNEEEAAVKSIVYTLTELPDIEGVQILIEGDKQATLAGYVNIREPLKREIITGRFQYRHSYLTKLKEKMGEGDFKWRLSPLEVAKREGRIAGFLPGDTYDGLEYKKDGRVSINVTHDGKAYKIFLIQPLGNGKDDFWVINRVEADFTPIPALNYSMGERYIRGTVVEVKPKDSIIVIDRIFADTPDTKVEAGPEINVMYDAIIHIKSVIAYKDGKIPQYKEVDGSLEDIKPGYEVGLIINKKKKARAVIAVQTNY